MKTNLIGLFTLLIFAFGAKSQLNIQKGSVQAPDNVKIDGNLSEWGNKLQARNKVDNLSYTISNDEDYLYLAILAPYKATCRKAMRGGITFTISKLTTAQRKNDKTAKAITFPVSKNAQNMSFAPKFSQYFEFIDKTSKGNKQRDSLLTVINNKAAEGFTLIELDDKPTMVIKLDIKACARFNKNLDLVYELAIPLKYYGLDAAASIPFSYNICLKGNREERKIDYSIPAPTPRPGVSLPPPDPQFLPTDFWGEYTLAPKP